MATRYNCAKCGTRPYLWVAGVEVNREGTAYLECDTCGYRSAQAEDRWSALDVWNDEQEARIKEQQP